ncbi:GTP-binding protein [Desulfonatronum thiosulfatophilum]|uniref:GTPase Obg n=2 Tax=Desulfonatronum thiosulfatophilum TaxID=617002 RepID=A0A1G6EH17_9BACT|nr:GTP-binding protein [Desulfonatronum thiosulfatophilum]
MRFVDEAEITVRSGHGGHGCVSFRREKYIAKGGPDGGDGGKGGDVIFRGNSKLLSLYDFRLKRLYEARNGQPGSGREKTGAKADDLVVDVPLGTQLYEVDEDGVKQLLADLAVEGQTVHLVKGGRGGKGNTHFKSATMRTPRFAQPGEEGEEKRIRLELKILADVGIIGLPNAGKSTLISALSAARPKIAPYPFTTLSPNLGVMLGEHGEKLILADIPGLVSGAHEGRGLGHKFLKHVERTRFLLHVLSVEEVSLEDDPWAGFALLNEELGSFDPALGQKQQLWVVNKIDLWPEERLAMLRERAEHDGKDLLLISALQAKGLEELEERLWLMLKQFFALEEKPVEEEIND